MACLLRVSLPVRHLRHTSYVRHNRHSSPACHNRHASQAIVYSAEVQQAKMDNKPLVALESTIITHGMPYPHNIQTALAVENIIRENGAVPATIAIIKGQLHVGLSEAQLEYLAQAKGVVKASRRDLAPVMAAKQDGATTVAGTIIAAELADIPIFVTGGIGGVHREAESTMDISADLTELGRSKTLVVCSGVKSILDIGRTLEYLETQGVTVCAFGDTTDFPAFYTRQSGHVAPNRAADASHAARILLAAKTFLLGSGIVIAVPVPEQHAMDGNVIEAAISRALLDAKSRGIRGKEVTPFILAAVSEATQGASLNTNIALIKNNAKVGAEIAVQFNKLRNSSGRSDKIARKNDLDHVTRKFHTECGGGEEAVLVIGGANVDRAYRVTEDNVQLDGSTHPCKISQCGGGVGRNMAEALWQLRRGRTRLLTAVGNDADGAYLQDIAPGLFVDGCVVDGARTATYAAVFDKKGECLLGLGDMEVHNLISIDLVKKHVDKIRNAQLVVLDGNIPQATMDYVLQLCCELKKPTFFEPTDRRKAIKVLSRSQVSYSSPNIAELRAMAKFIEPTHSIKADTTVEEIIELYKIISQFVDFLLVTLGEKGVVTIRKVKNCEPNVQVYNIPDVLNNVENVSGAGDCFASGFIYGILQGMSESSCISTGFKTARASLVSKNNVPSHFDG
ncbi:pseudouridine-metabolizing bifunctional protein C1861.05 [Aricia agestis]|uniref:pseudouridine-metabolizing bifunctional protein C1861.05 n=1 Tax=Aricia agestis TaxID=91739 RepID=UPI001C201D17|nr:pseudouridine-metabolizing bifunctional protein C1861.05 [Aricia agestis]